ncbi:acyltransferase [Clostridium bowmanii]|uniref:acyltransferase family protein n=1 Tax=Clostridium bowmanii TaxID=132925 RepID=UPI001C0AC48F|nr:acyltransferase [Clostridium bowmanii]MBU3188448.1 acyltransferase [Clostridium bowmanii]MCA1072836.1 acyltransferase [Clostridium bowmanii]
MGKIDYLDSCKGIAILGVFLVHSTMLFSLFKITSLPFSIEQLLYTGRLGVAIFFIISGYTVFRSLMNKTAQKNFFLKYVARKFFRLAVPFYCVLLVAYILSLIVMKNELNITSSNMLMHFTFLYGLDKDIYNNILGVEWFLFDTFIFSFLILIPYKFKKHLTSKNTLALFVATLLISFLFSLGIQFLKGKGAIDTTTFSWLYFSPINWLFTFSAGIFMFYFFQDINISKIRFINKYSKILVIFVVGSIILISYLNLHFENILVSLLFIVLIFTLHSVWFINKKMSSLFKIFDNKLFSNLGKISYSFYLVHYLVLRYLKEYVPTDIFTSVPWINYFLLVLISFALSLAVAYILYLFIERKPTLLEKFLIKKLSAC